MFRKNLPYLFILSLVVLSVVALALSFNRSETRADLLEFYISIDESELQTVVNEEALAGRSLDFQIRRVRNGIAVVKTTNGPARKTFDPDARGIIINAPDLSRTRPKPRHSIQLTKHSPDEKRTLRKSFIRLTIRQASIRCSRKRRSRRFAKPSLTSPLFRIADTTRRAARIRRIGLKNKWTQMAAGRSDITVDFFVHPTATSPQPSVILTVQGTTLPSEVVVLGAHQDSINGSSQTANARARTTTLRALRL